MNYPFRPGGEGGNGPPEGKFTKLGGKVNFGVLSSTLNVIRAKKGAIGLFLTNKTSFSCQKLLIDSMNMSAGIQMKNGVTYYI